nr:MAG TPA: hypothetical protein [Caudoviricetes sp.]
MQNCRLNIGYFCIYNFSRQKVFYKCRAECASGNAHKSLIVDFEQLVARFFIVQNYNQ